MEFSRPEFWSGQPLPSSGDLPDPGIKPGSPALQADFQIAKNPMILGVGLGHPGLEPPSSQEGRAAATCILRTKIRESYSLDALAPSPAAQEQPHHTSVRGLHSASWPGPQHPAAATLPSSACSSRTSFQQQQEAA